MMFIALSVLIARGSFYNQQQRVSDIGAAAIEWQQRRCRSIVGQAWQCWARFGHNQRCSDIIRQAWQCPGDACIGGEFKIMDRFISQVPGRLMLPVFRGILGQGRHCPTLAGIFGCFLIVPNNNQKISKY